MSDFGASFRRARESLGVTLEQVAQETRVNTRFLKAIEDEEFHLLPGGIFNRGFIRTYASRLGLDPNQAVSEYEQLTETQQPEEPPRPTSAEPSKVERNLYPIALGALVLLVVIFYVAQREPGPAPEPPAPPDATQPAPVSPSPEAATKTPETDAATAPQEKQTVLPQQPTPPPATTPVVPPAPQARRESAPAGTLALELEVREATWVKLTTDGNPVIAGIILQPGDRRRYTAGVSIDLTVGNAAGITLRVNGKEVRPLGRSGQVRSIVITPDNVKKFTG